MPNLANSLCSEDEMNSQGIEMMCFYITKIKTVDGLAHLRLKKSDLSLWMSSKQFGNGNRDDRPFLVAMHPTASHETKSNRLSGRQSISCLDFFSD